MKRTAQTVIAILLLLSLCACSLTEEELRERAVNQLNKNSDLPFGLTQPEAELEDTDTYRQGGGWGCRSIFDDDIDILLSGYPDCLDEYHITEIRLLTPKYSIFGIHVGDAPERAGELLEPKGYELVPDVRGWGVDAYYLKDGVFIYLEFGYLEDGQKVISGLTAYVLTTNIEGVDF